MNGEESEIADDYESSESEMETSDHERLDDEEMTEVKSGVRGQKLMDDSRHKHHDPDLVDMQKVDVFLQQLPYFDQIKLNAVHSFAEIKKNLTEAIVLNEIRPGFVHWTNRLIVYVHEFGLFFSKQDHVKLIKLYLSVVLTPNIDLSAVDFCLNALIELLKKIDKLNRQDLVIEWRPLYDLYLRINKLDDFSYELAPENLEGSTFVNFIKYARVYFDTESTKEMLEEFRRYMCPFDSAMSSAFERCKLFLPTVLYEHETAHGYKLWLEEFLHVWTSFDSRHFWDTHILSLFARVSTSIVGEFDWSPYIPFIFSHLIRGFGLPFNLKDSIALGIGGGAGGGGASIGSISSTISQLFVFTNQEIIFMSRWIVSMISTGKDRELCMNHIKQLFSALRSFYYPSNTGSWSSNLFLFLKSLPDAFIKRIREEKKEKAKWYDRPAHASCHITDEDTTNFVNCLKDVVLTAIFSKSNFSEAKQAYQYLTFMRGEIMLPPLIEKVYESAQSVIEPHRYTSILSCLVSVAREFVKYNRFHENQTQLHVMPLLEAVLPGLDPNDASKCCLTLQFLQNVFDAIVVCNCQPAVNYRSDLTEHERELCFETNKFEDFIHEFFKKVLYLIDCLASDTSAESSASAAAASNQFALTKSKNLDESVYQIQLIGTIKVLIRQSSGPILKIIANKLKNYINGNSFNARSGRILANLCGLLAWNRHSGNHAFNIFFEYAYENLRRIKDTKSYESILKDERGDIEVSWNLQLLAELTKANGSILIENMNKINQLLSWYRYMVHKESVGYISYCYRNVITSLESIYPVEMASVNYSIIYDDEQKFFTENLPIRDWGCKSDLFNLKPNFHIPTVQELETALEFARSSLSECYKFLTETVINNKTDTLLASKEERNRELNYINHIIYAASRLLKRPTDLAIINVNPDTSVEIGHPDNINKGLGFDLANVNNPDHEYSKLSPEYKSLMLNMRKEMIEYMIKLADVCLVKYSTETSVLMLIARILSTASITYGAFVNDFEKAWKNFFQLKNALKNPLNGKRNSTRPELIQRIMLQYKFRTFHIHTRLNELDVRVIEILFRLSIDSNYAIVRKDSQSQLFSMLAHFPYSSLLISPRIVDILNRFNDKSNESNKVEHDQLKGCLYLLSGNSVNESLMVKQNWKILHAVWPALFRCQQFEKASIQTLLDRIYYKANKDYDSFDNRIKLSDKAVHAAYDLCPETQSRFASIPESQRLAKFVDKCRVESELIKGLMNELIEICREPQQIWRNQSTSLGSLSLLFNTCIVQPDILSVECMDLIVNSLVSENITVRKVSIDALCILLKMVKPPKQTRMYDTIELIQKEARNRSIVAEKIPINRAEPGHRADNTWHTYNPQFLFEQTEQGWEATNFLDKSYWGYYCWPSRIRVNLNSRETYSLDDVKSESSTHLSKCMKPLRDKFMNDSEFVEKFIKLSRIEESKGHEKFDKKKLYLFKSLFRNFGSTKIFNSFYDHLKRLIVDKEPLTHECSHKLAAEMVSGLIRGSKYWKFEQLKELWSETKPILDLIVENMTTETLKLWTSCFSNAFEDQDPRRLTFYINYFSELVRRVIFKKDNENDNDFVVVNEGSSSSPTSFQQASCLNLIATLSQEEWRAQLLWSSLIDLFQANMTHPYKSIREKIASCFTLFYMNEIDYSLGIAGVSGNSVINTCPRREHLSKFVDFLEARLKQSIELFEYVKEESIDANSEADTTTKTQQHLSAVVFLQSTLSFLGNYMMKSYQPMNQELLRLVPLLCSVDKIAAQDPLVKTSLPLIRLSSSMWLLGDKDSSLLIDKFSAVTQLKSWHSRLAGLQIINNFGIFNQFMLPKEKKTAIKNIVLGSIVDEQLEVRIQATLALTGFIHSNFISVDQDLINHLKQLSKIKARKKDAESGKMVLNTSNLIKRHGGVLGLCSIVNAAPYDVPAYLPDLLTYLCEFINDPVPIQGSVKKCLSEFRRTHHDNWSTHKEKFDESQLSVLTDVLISPNYYA